MSGHAALLSALEEFAWPVKAAAEIARGAHIIPYDKGSTIFHAGEAADIVYVLLSGEATLEYGAEGGSLLVSIARSGQMLGLFAPELGAATKTRPEQVFSARALSRCKVAIIPTSRIAHGLQRLSSADLVRVLESSRDQWVRLCRRLLGYLTMSVRGRLVHALGEIADHFGVSDASGRLITLRLSHENFAALVGASRPMVSKHLKEFEVNGISSREGGRYRVLTGALESALAGDPATAGDGGRAPGAGRARRREEGAQRRAMRVETGGRLHSLR